MTSLMTLLMTAIVPATADDAWPSGRDGGSALAAEGNSDREGRCPRSARCFRSPVCPRWRLTMCLTMARPRPVPPSAALRAGVDAVEALGQPRDMLRRRCPRRVEAETFDPGPARRARRQPRPNGAQSRRGSRGFPCRRTSRRCPSGSGRPASARRATPITGASGGGRSTRSRCRCARASSARLEATDRRICGDVDLAVGRRHVCIPASRCARATAGRRPAATCGGPGRP